MADSLVKFKDLPDNQTLVQLLTNFAPSVFTGLDLAALLANEDFVNAINAYATLTNYYLTSQTFTKAEVNAAILVVSNGLSGYITSNNIALGNVNTDLQGYKSSNDSALGLKADLVAGKVPASQLALTKSQVGLSNVVNSDTSTTANITDSVDKRFVTDAFLALLGSQAAVNASLSNYALITPTVRATTTTNETLQAGDNGNVVTCNNAGLINLTVPPSLGAKFNCLVIQIGAGQVALVASSTTLNSGNGLKTRVQYSSVSLFAYLADIFNVAGDLTV